MASFDIVSEVDLQKLDNAINVANKEIVNRYDFYGSKTEITLDKKEKSIRVVTENEMRMNTLRDIIISRMMKQGLSAECLDFGKAHYASGNMIRKDIRVKEGVDKDTARKIVKMVKNTKLKVQASIMDEQVRVTGKQFDDLQNIISMLEKSSLGIPLQFVNYR